MLWYGCDKGLFTLARCRSSPSACFFSSIAFSCFCFSSIFHPEGITRIGNSFKFLNKFLNCQSQTIFWKLYVLLSKNLYLLNGCKKISKFANVVWFFGLIFQAGCWRVVVSFFISERHFGILKILYCHCRTWRHIFPSPFYIVLLSTTDRGCIFNNRLSTRLGSIEHAWHLGYKRLLSLIYHLILRRLGPFLYIGIDFKAILRKDSVSRSRSNVLAALSKKEWFSIF